MLHIDYSQQFIFNFRKKHKKHKRSKKSRDVEENGNGAVIDKIVTQIVKRKDINGKANHSLMEIDSEESDEEKMVDLDSDEVDCAIIEDDMNLEELMKQKVFASKESN